MCSNLTIKYSADAGGGVELDVPNKDDEGGGVYLKSPRDAAAGRSRHLSAICLVDEQARAHIPELHPGFPLIHPEFLGSDNFPR
ncbi:unnamed protein product [Spirodela intermedia]|uniref:Uncharacterized protein n=2 Tax=Spirodela intermedia TaxID=51605 RepID=A0A7I8LMD3_SPIIN|nr:unnamed protein product [Spirodela intermedia]CAA6673800.1 unnamed protein product [Spirodela intermedia]CAA7411042.1 unnamed protein product [Spirodela intermedia]